MRLRLRLRDDGEKRIRRWFAILPVRITTGPVDEWRWLEMVTVEQQFVAASAYFFWQNVRFCEANEPVTQTRTEVKVQFPWRGYAAKEKP